MHGSLLYIYKDKNFHFLNFNASVKLNNIFLLLEGQSGVRLRLCGITTRQDCETGRHERLLITPAVMHIKPPHGVLVFLILMERLGLLIRYE